MIPAGCKKHQVAEQYPCRAVTKRCMTTDPGLEQAVMLQVPIQASSGQQGSLPRAIRVDQEGCASPRHGGDIAGKTQAADKQKESKPGMRKLGA
jgi:translation elongation factor EF-4